MLTLHRAALLIADPAAPAAPASADGAVLVDGGLVAWVGPYADRPDTAARLREWPGLLVPGLLNPYGACQLERRYHPDPREELGADPLVLDVPDERRGGSARRGLQRMLGHGTTAVAGPFAHPAVRTAVARSGLTAVPGDGADGGLDPLAGRTLAEAVHRPLRTGGPADFAVFAAGSAAELERSGAGCCLATVLGGRLLYRGR
ncbi:hypothetical protein [Kitasatospora sp. DSM 101779]|uniref:hypothetical protein n=1 Tax=Kitasatospora sp. DSM 101779 TaxID=2853165 RepID=UPI0021DAB40D|nr:hypothetical protein [Kitasatospora sp. DSM 101779]MCU7823278.1 hypothetical protein [Kitasatospora sp. DSM 101779]